MKRYGPYRSKGGYLFHSYRDGTTSRSVYVHREVMEATIGRPLAKTELVHHKNGKTNDNRPENLQIVSSSEHARIHLARPAERLAASLS